MRSPLVSLALVLLSGCAHSPVSVSGLRHARGVAIVARIEDEAGPKSTVFRDDASYRVHLQPRHIGDKEADRRLANVLANGTFEKDASGRHLKAPTMTRFELADSLRSHLLARLPNHEPWASTVSASAVARAFESFLVQEVPANAPDYHRLLELGADTVVELVVESYGMHSEKGRAGLYLIGSARMFRIDGAELYHRHFYVDELEAGQPHLDPFAVAKNATLFSERLRPIILGIAEQIASDLSPEGPMSASPHSETPARHLPADTAGEDPL